MVSVNLLEAFPAVKRLALKLPVKSLRTTRDALTPPAPGTMPVEGTAGPSTLDAAHPHPDVQDLAVIQYTSRHHRAPQGRDAQPLQPVCQCPAGRGLDAGAQQRQEIFYAMLPMFHAFGMTMYLTFGVRKQGLLVLFPKFDADLVLAAMKKSPPTVYCAVPPIYERTVLAAREKGVSLRSAKYCISGAMNLPVDSRAVGIRLRRTAGRGLRHDRDLARGPGQPVRTQPEHRDASACRSPPR